MNLCLSKVWNVERAMLLRVFEEEHEEQVNHCQFTNTARRLLLATCSNDKFMNVKVCQCLLLFCCVISDFIVGVNKPHTDDGEIIYCANFVLSYCVPPFLFLQLWNLNKPSSQNTMFGHFEPVNHCCFSPDDSYVSTSSNDGTVKVTAVKLDSCKPSFPEAVHIKMNLIM